MKLSDVAEMSLDQVFMLLTDRKNLKSKGVASKSFTPSESSALLKPDADGFIKGRTADGQPMKARIGGRSLASRMREEMERKEAKEKGQKTKEEGRQKRVDRRKIRAERRKHRGN